MAGKVTFRQAIADYDAKYSKDWGASYAAQKKNQERRMIAYFGDTDVRKIDTLAVEEFFEWCHTPNEVYSTALGNNTIEKYKTHLSDIWKFMKKGKKYGVTENVVTDADIGEIEKFEAKILTIEQVKYLLWYVTHCEKDYSVFSLRAIPVLAGLRRGELCGLRWKDIDFEKTDHPHAHFVVEPVSFLDGIMLHRNKQDLEQATKSEKLRNWSRFPLFGCTIYGIPSFPCASTEK